jgi:CheY-like chemotaxis protein
MAQSVRGGRVVWFRVHSVTDGVEALTVLEVQTFDLILLDIRLPHLSGFEVARRLRARGDTTPIIAVTACAYPEQREKCSSAGIDGYLRKPYLYGQLLDEVARVMASR